MTLDQLKRQYLEDLEIEKGRSLKTIANYDRYLTRFFTFSKLNDPKDITDDILREYQKVGKQILLSRQFEKLNLIIGKAINVGLVADKLEIPVVGDSSDNKYVELLNQVSADYIISRDAHLLSDSYWRDFCLSPKTFLKLFRQSEKIRKRGDTGLE